MNINKMKSRTVKLGEVGVDSGQLMICDPSYIEAEYKFPNDEGKADHAHAIYRHKPDGKLWQFCFGGQPATENVNSFPGNYADVIPEYGLCPNDLIEQGLFEETSLDPTPHIPDGEFSYRSICKMTNSENYMGQLKYKLGHAGVAVAFRSGFGDGTYGVFAEIIDTVEYGERIKKVWIELIDDAKMKEFEIICNRQVEQAGK